MKIEDFLSRLYIRLAEVSETPKLDAEVLLSHVLSKSRAWILAHPEASLSAEQEELLDELVAQSTRGVPLPYVIGHWEFYGLDFVVTPATLIPRPETELLVERALSWLQERPHRRRAVDVGTGSGCISVTLATKITELVVFATDTSREALKVAQENAQRHGVADRVQIAQMDLLSATRATFDLVCANLPYIPTQTLRGLRVYGKEPELALDGGPTGLDLIRKLLQSGKGRLSVGGLMLLEIEATQVGAVKDLIEESFPEGVVNILPDLAGRDRLVTIRKPSD